MFRSNVRAIMDKKGKTIRDISGETGIALGTIHRATQDATIGACQLNTLAKISAALGVKTVKLFDEVPDKFVDGNGPAEGEAAPPQEKDVDHGTDNA